MPELAEVAYYCSLWSPGKGRRIKRVQTHGATRCFRESSGESVENKLRGRTLKDSRTHGKRMLFQFSKGAWLGLHLGMTGKLVIRKPFEELQKHDHLALETSAGWLVFNDPRQFGKVELFQSEDLPDEWANFPLEILSLEFNYKYFEQLLGRRKRAVLKSLLLDQTLFPGVGNWMADEILWKARIRPDRRLESLSTTELKALFDTLKFVCRGAMKYVATDYSDPPKSWLFRHRWKPGGICPKTREDLSRSEIGGRTTCWSPAWQR
jgi:formamidopyrimidine-DNA glycosylase